MSKLPNSDKDVCPWCQGECLVTKGGPQPISSERLRELVESWRERIGSGDWPRICAAELEALYKEPGE